MPVYHVSQLLGHTNVQTTQRWYLSLNLDAYKEAVRSIERLVRINTLFQHSEKYRNPRESPVTPSFRCLIHERWSDDPLASALSVGASAAGEPARKRGSSSSAHQLFRGSISGHLLSEVAPEI